MPELWGRKNAMRSQREDARKLIHVIVETRRVFLRTLRKNIAMRDGVHADVVATYGSINFPLAALPRAALTIDKSPSAAASLMADA